MGETAQEQAARAAEEASKQQQEAIRAKAQEQVLSAENGPGNAIGLERDPVVRVVGP